MEIKNVAFASIIIACLAVSYYFVIALPNQNKVKFELEKQKFEMEKNQQQERESSLLECRASVERERNRYLELNGIPIPDKPGTYRISGAVTERLSQIERDGYQECTRMYGAQR